MKMLIESAYKAWLRKDLISYMVVSDLKRSYSGKMLGYLWSLLDPLLLMITYVFLVSIVFKRGGEYFPVLVLTSILIWKMSSSAINASVHCLRAKSRIILSIDFPLLTLPVSLVLTHMCRLLLASIVLIPFLFMFNVGIGWQILWLPVILVAHVSLILGITMLVSILGIFFRDIEHIVPFMMQVWFYGSPILYSIEELVPIEYHAFIYIINPLAAMLTSYKNILIFNLPPTGWVILSSVISCILLIIGLTIFSKYERKVAKNF